LFTNTPTLSPTLVGLALEDPTGFVAGEVITSDPAFVPLLRLRAILDEPALAARLGEEATGLLLLTGPYGCGRRTAVRWLASELAQPVRILNIYASSLTLKGWTNLTQSLAVSNCLTILMITNLDETLTGGGQYSPRRGVSQRAVATRQALTQLVKDPRILICLIADNDEIMDNWVSKLVTHRAWLGDISEKARTAFLTRELSKLPLAETPDWEMLGFISQVAIAPYGFWGGFSKLKEVVNNLAEIIPERPGGLQITDIIAALRFSNLNNSKFRYTPTTDRAAEWLNAVHESGHAAAALCLFGPEALLYADSIRVAEPQNPTNWRSAGTVWHQSSSERIFDSEVDSLEALVVTAAGRWTESLVLGKAAGGCASDFLALRASLLHRLAATMSKEQQADYSPLMNYQVPPDFTDRVVYKAGLEGLERLEREITRAAREIIEANRTAITTFAEKLITARVLFGSGLQQAVDESGFVTPAGDPIRSDRPFVKPGFGLTNRALIDDLAEVLLDYIATIETPAEKTVKPQRRARPRRPAVR
jgi:hypothetical protein